MSALRLEIDDATHDAVEAEFPPMFRRPSAQAILRAVAASFDVAPADILAMRRTSRVVTARQAAMHLVRRLTHLSLPQIGTLFDRDHTTVLHAVRAIETRRSHDAGLNARLNDLTLTLRMSAQRGAA